MRRDTRSSSQTSRTILLLMLSVVLIPLTLVGAWALQPTSDPARPLARQVRQALASLPPGGYQSTSAPRSERAGGDLRFAMASRAGTSTALVGFQDVPTTGWESLGRTVLAIVVIIVVAGGLLLFFGERITRPIRRLTATDRMPPESGRDQEIAAESTNARETETTLHMGLSTIGRIGQAITSSLDLNTLLEDMANHLAETVDATGSLIILLDPETQLPVPMAAYGKYCRDCNSLELQSQEPSAAMAAISGQQPVIIRDMSKSLLVAPQLSHGLPDKSMLVLPLIVKRHAIGAALVGDNRRIRDFRQDEVDVAMAVAGQFAVAIDNARLYETTQRHLHDLSLLYQTSAAISTTLDEQAVFEMAIQALKKVYDVAECQIIVWGHDALGRLVAEHHPGAPGPISDAGVPLTSDPLLEWMEENRRPLPIRQEQLELLQSLRKLAHAENLRSALVVPLVAKGDVIGCTILLAEDTRRFSSEEISLAQTLANQIASVVQNARLYRQMEEEKRKFELAALNMGEGLIILDREDALLFANPQAQTLLGLGSCPSLGMPLATACPQPQLLALLEQRSRSDETIVSGEMQIGEPELRDLTLSVAPVRDESGELEWWIIVIHDISDLKELDRLKSEFISTISHELRTPLASIMGFSEMMMTRQPGPLTSVQEEFMSIIYESSENLLTLVNDLLDVSRIESGRFTLQVRWVDLTDVMNRAYATLIPLAQQKPLDLVLEIPAHLPQISADPRRLEQVLTNLIHNAVKFTPAGGKVKILAAQEDAAMLFTVSDTGMGIPAQDMEKLFTKFYRSTQVMRSAIAGTGLGLYIAKNIVESHGGSIGVESTENKGTTVWFTIPLDGPTLPEVE